MDIALHGYYYRLKRYWRRKKYERLEDSTTPKRKLKVVRLGSSKKRPNSVRIRRAPKLRFMFILPLKMVAKFHEAYVNLGGPKMIENSKEKKSPKTRPLPMMLSAANNQATVDVRMVMELYQRMATQRELSGHDIDSD